MRRSRTSGASFVAITTREPDPALALAAVMADSFELSEQEVHRNRVLVAEQGRLSHPSSAQPEEEARLAAPCSHARPRVRVGRASYPPRCAQGAIPDSDPRLFTRAVLGLYNSIRHWYRPNGIVALTRIGEHFTGLALAMVGVPPEALPSGRPREPQEAPVDARAA